MTLRMVAGETFSGSRRDRVRLPTGSPVSTYCSTISRSTAAERGSRPGGSGVALTESSGGAPVGVTGLSIGVELQPPEVGSGGDPVNSGKQPRLCAGDQSTGLTRRTTAGSALGISTGQQP